MTFSGVAGGLRQPVHAVDEGQHDGQQGDDQGEGQRRHGGGLPAHGEVAEVVAERHLAQRKSNASSTAAAAESIRMTRETFDMGWRQATLEKTSATLTLRAVQAGTMLPSRAVPVPMPMPHQTAAAGT